MSITGLMRRLSLIDIDAIWQLCLGCLLMRTIATFQRYTDYLNFINGPYKSRFIGNSSSCTTTELSILLTSCLTVIKKHVVKYCTTVYERNGKKLFWSIKNSGEILNRLESRGFIWLVMIKMHFLLLNNLHDINCSHVRKCVMLSIIFETIYL